MAAWQRPPDGPAATRRHGSDPNVAGPEAGAVRFGVGEQLAIRAEDRALDENVVSRVQEDSDMTGGLAPDDNLVIAGIRLRVATGYVAGGLRAAAVGDPQVARAVERKTADRHAAETRREQLANGRAGCAAAERDVALERPVPVAQRDEVRGRAT